MWCIRSARKNAEITAERRRKRKAQNDAKLNAEERGKLLYKEESYQLLGACFDLYKELGCGHKEILYQRGLLQKLKERKLPAEREVQIPIKVGKIKVGNYTPDLVVDQKILVEVKAKRFLTEQDRHQLWHYLTATSYKLGFMVNFGKPGGVEYTRRVYDTARRATRKNAEINAKECGIYHGRTQKLLQKGFRVILRKILHSSASVSA